MNKLRTNQGGSVASFIVIGVILFSLLVGSVYFVNKRSQEARKQQEIASDKKSESEKKPTKSDVSTSTDKVEVPEEKKESVEKASLPATGPGMDIIKLIGIFSLSTVLVSFVLSRKKLAHSL